MIGYLILAGFVSGIISGMGIGGGALLIPALTLLFGFAQQGAQGISLAVFLPAAIAALFVHKRSGRLQWRLSLKLAAIGALGAVAGAVVALVLPMEWARRAFGVFMAALAVWQFWMGEKKPS